MNQNVSTVKSLNLYGTTWYFKVSKLGNESPQSMAILDMINKKSTLLMCYEGQKGRMYGAYPNIDNFSQIYANVPDTERHFYEIIHNQPVKLFMDLDWELSCIKKENLLNIIKENLMKVYEEVFEDKLDWSTVLLLEACDETVNKGSLHLICNNGYCFASIEEQKMFWTYFKQKTCEINELYFLEQQETKLTKKSIIDYSVYHNHRAFRIALSCKKDSNRRLVSKELADGTTTVADYFVTNCDGYQNLSIDNIDVVDVVKKTNIKDEYYIKDELTDIIKRNIPGVEIHMIKDNYIYLKNNDTPRVCLIGDEVHVKNNSCCIIRNNRIIFKCFAKECKDKELEIGNIMPSEYDRNKNFDITICHNWLEQIEDHRDLQITLDKIIDYMNNYFGIITKETKTCIIQQYYDDLNNWCYVIQAQQAMKEFMENKKKNFTYNKLIDDAPRCFFINKINNKQCSKYSRNDGLCKIHHNIANETEREEYKNKLAVAINNMKTEPAIYSFDPFKLWISNLRRKEYNCITFNPNLNVVEPSKFNLFRGLPFTKTYCASYKNEDITPLLNHILNIWCKGNQAYFDYTINWMAHVLQFPWRKTQVAVVLKSIEGAGKGVVIEHLGKLLGNYYFQPQNTEDVLGRFTDQLQNKLLVFMDEMVWGGDKQKSGHLKKLITESTHRIEIKMMPAYNIESYLNIIMASNEQWIVPSGEGSRRYFVLEVDNRYAGMSNEVKRAYFDKIRKCSSEAFGYYLFSRDLSEFRPTEAPITDALRQQQLNTFPKTTKWWIDVLNRRYITTNKTFDKPITITELFETYKKESQDKHMTEKGFIDKMRELCPGFVVSSIVNARTDKQMYIQIKFPELAKVQESFRNSIKDFNWTFDTPDKVEKMTVEPMIIKMDDDGNRVE